MAVKKNFVLDTNVILHDHKCIYKFQEHDIYLPIVVLEELDKFKKETRKLISMLGSLPANLIWLLIMIYLPKELLWERV